MPGSAVSARDVASTSRSGSSARSPSATALRERDQRARAGAGACRGARCSPGSTPRCATAVGNSAWQRRAGAAGTARRTPPRCGPAASARRAPRSAGRRPRAPRARSRRTRPGTRSPGRGVAKRAQRRRDDRGIAGEIERVLHARQHGRHRASERRRHRDASAGLRGARRTSIQPTCIAPRCTTRERARVGVVRRPSRRPSIARAREEREHRLPVVRRPVGELERERRRQHRGAGASRRRPGAIR